MVFGGPLRTALAGGVRGADGGSGFCVAACVSWAPPRGWTLQYRMDREIDLMSARGKALLESAQTPFQIRAPRDMTSSTLGLDGLRGALILDQLAMGDELFEAAAVDQRSEANDGSQARERRHRASPAEY